MRFQLKNRMPRDVLTKLAMLTKVQFTATVEAQCATLRQKIVPATIRTRWQWFLCLTQWNIYEALTNSEYFISSHNCLNWNWKYLFGIRVDLGIRMIIVYNMYASHEKTLPINYKPNKFLLYIEIFEE